jgi:hypothetical protein
LTSEQSTRAVIIRKLLPRTVAGATRGRQDYGMTRATSDQGTLFGTAAPSRPTRRRQPPKQTTVTISADAIDAAATGRIDGERVIAEAIRAARPDVRNVDVDLGTIRWTDPKTRCRVTFHTPIVVRDALLDFARGAVPEPFRFIIGRAARVTRDC